MWLTQHQQRWQRSNHQCYQSQLTAAITNFGFSFQVSFSLEYIIFNKYIKYCNDQIAVALTGQTVGLKYEIGIRIKELSRILFIFISQALTEKGIKAQSYPSHLKLTTSHDNNLQRDKRGGLEKIPMLTAKSVPLKNILLKNTPSICVLCTHKHTRIFKKHSSR